MTDCIETECNKPRGGRNTRCWMHLKRLVRRNQAYRAYAVFNEHQILEADLDLPVEHDQVSGQQGQQGVV